MKKIAIILLILSLAACTKYDEGPKISFRNAYHLLIGHWSVSKYIVNSIDSTNHYLDYRACGIDMYFDHGYYFNLEYCKDVTYVGMAGGWSLNKKENSIYFYANYQENYWPLFNKTTLYIKRLTTDELILETDINQDHYRLELYK